MMPVPTVSLVTPVTYCLSFCWTKTISIIPTRRTSFTQTYLAPLCRPLTTALLKSVDEFLNKKN